VLAEERSSRLVISEGTVKSHVKQILRKIGAANRSEAIARYLGMIGSS
jgi:DNA-binding NarL/FixJ family response regulator